MKAKNKLFDWFKPIYGLLVVSLLISACGGGPPGQVEPTPIQPEASPTATAVPSPTPTPQPSVLNVCTAQEPAGLYRYDGRNSDSKKTIFSALYGSAIMEHDELGILLERLPSIENGDIQVLAVEVAAGDVVVDATGQLTVLKQNTLVIPHGCASAECVLTWDGESELALSALKISYQLKEDLRWSDGEPLTAEDVLFSYQVASAEATPTDKQIIDLTENVAVEGDRTFIWNGLPGLTNQKPEHSFWLPLPTHQLENLTPAELLESQLTNQEPLSWGANRLVSWEKGQQLRFERNSFFDGADPANTFDFLNIAIIPDQKAALEAFKAGVCDVLDSSYGLEVLPAEQLPGTIHVITPFDVGTLVFGVSSAEGAGVRADYFGDIRTRQAVALCIDPADLSKSLSGQKLAIGAPTLPDVDPNTLLEAVGWVDEDGNPATARISKGVESVSDLTPFAINLYSGQGALDTVAAAEVGKRLDVCGIEVNVSNLPAAQLYAPGPEGILFGRNFDLAIVNWAGNTSTADHCTYYLSSQVPSVENNWVGTNLPGYKDLAYDVACLTFTLSQHDPVDPIIALDLVPRAKFWMSRDGVLP